MSEFGNCGDCKFFVKNENKINEGTCHKNPPTVVGGAVVTPQGPIILSQSFYPGMKPDDLGCYEFASVGAIHEI